MSGFDNAKGNIGMLRKSYKKRMAAGEMVLGSEFELNFIGHPEMNVMVRSAQIPEFKRQEVEDTGPMGLMVKQQGPLITAGQITVQVVEDLKGTVYQFVRDCIVNKTHLNLELRITPESLGGESAASGEFTMLDCTIALEMTDVSTEDNTMPLKPSLLITYNWAEPEVGR